VFNFEEGYPDAAYHRLKHRHGSIGCFIVAKARHSDRIQSLVGKHAESLSRLRGRIRGDVRGKLPVAAVGGSRIP
jgi:hypothetical protein